MMKVANKRPVCHIALCHRFYRLAGIAQNSLEIREIL